MVGDNLETDILFAERCKVDTLCVLTGNTNEEMALKNDIVVPTYYSSNLGSSP